MNKIILCIISMTMAMAVDLSAQALSWSGYPYSPYQNINPAQIIQQGQAIDYSTNPVYGQNYNQPYVQNPYQTQCQYPGQYINPYQYQRYGYGTPYSTVNSALNGLNTVGGGNQIIKNIGRSMFYSMLRGY